MDARVAESSLASQPFTQAQPRVGNMIGKRSSLARLLREPIVHFVLAGAAIFAISEMVEHYTSQYRIEIGPEQAARISATFQQQYGSLPTDAQLAALKKNYIREEILYRESLALGLDRGDEIVRRRLAQKFEFLQQDLQALNEPTEAQVEAYFSSHSSDYYISPRRSFSHIFFSPDADGGNAGARRRAAEALAQLRREGAPLRPRFGDVFAGPSDFADLDLAGAKRLFGDEGFSADLFTVPTGQWAGPFRSGFGWHLAFVFSETPGKQPSLSEVAVRVREDVQASLRVAQNAEAFEKIQSRYDIVDRTAEP